MFCVASRKPFYLALSKRLYVCKGCVFVLFVWGAFVLFVWVRLSCPFVFIAFF